MFKCIKDINKNNINECNIMNNTKSSISLLIKMTIKATFRIILRSGKTQQMCTLFTVPITNKEKSLKKRKRYCRSSMNNKI